MTDSVTRLAEKIVKICDDFSFPQSQVESLLREAMELEFMKGRNQAAEQCNELIKEHEKRKRDAYIETHGPLKLDELMETIVKPKIREAYTRAAEVARHHLCDGKDHKCIELAAAIERIRYEKTS